MSRSSLRTHARASVGPLSRWPRSSPQATPSCAAHREVSSARARSPRAHAGTMTAARRPCGRFRQRQHPTEDVGRTSELIHPDDDRGTTEHHPACSPASHARRTTTRRERRIRPLAGCPCRRLHVPTTTPRSSTMTTTEEARQRYSQKLEKIHGPIDGWRDADHSRRRQPACGSYATERRKPYLV